MFSGFPFQSVLPPPPPNSAGWIPPDAIRTSLQHFLKRKQRRNNKKSLDRVPRASSCVCKFHVILSGIPEFRKHPPSFAQGHPGGGGKGGEGKGQKSTTYRPVLYFSIQLLLLLLLLLLFKCFSLKFAEFFRFFQRGHMKEKNLSMSVHH